MRRVEPPSTAFLSMPLPEWALAGHAGYFKDPLTAHGITDVFCAMRNYSRAVAHGTTAAFADYEQTRLDLSRRLFEVTDEIASFAWPGESVQCRNGA